jgi:hypothetical protein
MMSFYRNFGLGLTLACLSSGVGWGQAAMAQPGATWYNCLTREVFTPEKRAWCDRWQAVQEATLIVPTSVNANPSYTTVTLENGQYEQPNGPLQVVLVNEQNWLTFGDVNGDGQQDAAVIFGVSPDDDTVGTYLTTILDIDSETQALQPVRLGEPILLNGPITIQDNRVMVPQLTQTMVINRELR